MPPIPSNRQSPLLEVGVGQLGSRWSAILVRVTSKSVTGFENVAQMGVGGVNGGRRSGRVRRYPFSGGAPRRLPVHKFLRSLVMEYLRR